MFLDHKDLPYLEKYYKKLPGFWAKYFREEYSKENIKGDTLGQRINFLKNRFSQLCMSHNIQRKAKRINTQIYCKDTKAIMLDRDLVVKPYWFIEIETLVTILKAIENLDEDLKRKIVSIIALRIKREEERRELIYNSYSFHSETNMMDTSDYYYSE